MAYLDIITLADAKTYLRIDDTLTEDDAQITRMIKASLSQIERVTNYILFARSKSYVVENLSVNVYDFPINSLTSPTTATSVEKSIYTTYTTIVSTDLKVTLNVGYSNASDVPSDLIEVAYEMIDLMYYSPETGKSIKSDLSELSKMVLSNYKRFFI
tara:strand:- start:1546 stop:2016 length:471 start_codon:yes stop_codon:yes gene_type:complete